MADSHGRFAWYELMTTDMEAAKAFYAAVVGWGVADASMPGMSYALLTVEGASVCGLVGLPEGAKKIGAKPTWIGYVGVDDVDAAADRIKRLGGVVHLPPQNIGDVSRFSIVADPQMATLALLQWLKPRREQPAEFTAPGRIRWHELLAADWEKVFPFYGELFGWQKGDSDTEAMGHYQQFTAGGQPIGGMFTKPSAITSSFWRFYFNTGDIDAAAKRVKAGGGEILDGPAEVSGGSWILQCADPQGAMFALVGTRSRITVGYFERVGTRDPADARARRWSW